MHGLSWSQSTHTSRYQIDLSTPAKLPRMQVVLITGCGSGLGKAVARCFHDQKAFGGKTCRFRVFASDLEIHTLEDLQVEGVETLQLDVTSPDSVQRAVEYIEHVAGGIDILLCNSGIIRVAPIIEEDLSEIQAVWNVNT